MRFTLAVDRDCEVGGEVSTDSWPVEAAREHATRLAPYLTNGRILLCAGSAHVNTDRGEDGHYRVFPYVNARQVRFLDRAPRTEDGE